MARFTVAAVLILALVAMVSATVYFEETFDGSYADRWVNSNNKGAEAGAWSHSAGRFFRDPDQDKGIQTTTDYRFYQTSAVFPEFSNEGETLVLQFSVKHEQNLDCGGGYIKLLPAGFDQEDFSGDTPYNVMFGPDICGTGTRRIHAILNHDGENYLINEDIPCETDTYTHVYTFILNADQTFKILVDNQVKKEGKIEDSWDILAPSHIRDPSESKPEDWVDQKTIDDPEAVKPEGYDDITAFLSDPEATEPEDWDTELDGEWEAPQIRNPEYKGPWRAPQIPNPAYVGEWEHPLIENPDYQPNSELYKFESNAGVGIEIWQVKAGSLFDNILVTNDVELASERAEEAILRTEAEREQQQEETAQRAAREAEERARLEEEFAEEDDEEEEEDSHNHTHDEL